MENYNEEKKEVKGIVYWFVGLIFVLSMIGFLCNRTVSAVDNGIIHYEEFQELYNTCTKINTDLCNMKDLPDTDKMFEQFSKTQRMNTLRTNLNMWVEDYNAKSKMWNRSLWKSNSLPYQLTTNQFNCY